MTSTSAPDWLSERATAFWPDVVLELQSRGNLAKAPAELVGVYCETFAEYVDATVRVQSEGLTHCWYSDQGSQHEDVAPVFKAQMKLVEKLRQLAKDLGLHDEPNDRLDRLRGRLAGLAGRSAHPERN